MAFSKIHTFLPVYNRSHLTADFVLHLKPQLSPFAGFKIWILDDGCTDDTVSRVQEVCPSVEVVKLSGNAFWGGALNVIRQIILNRREQGFTDECYLVCNDDIRFPVNSLNVALSALRSNKVVCALPTAVSNTCLEEDQLSADLFVGHSPMHRFDPYLGKFVVESNPQLVNTASTYAMLTTSEPWFFSDPIPVTIPHYLSDWWLTYDFHLHGFSVTHPNGFRCFTWSETTNNRVLEKYLPSGLGRLRLSIVHLLHVARASVDRSSPYYAPAWITLLKSRAESPLTILFLLRYYLLYFLGNSLRLWSLSQESLKSAFSR